MDTNIAKKRPHKVLAIELFALTTSITIKEVAAKIGVADISVA